MGAFAKWLMRDEQRELFDLLFAVALNVLFLALVALALWPLGRAKVAFHLAQGYGIFWFVMDVAFLLLVLFRRILRVEMETNFDAYVISALVVSVFLQAGWSAFAALSVHSFVDGAPVAVAVLLYLVGVASCYIAFVVVSSVYAGHIYKLINLPLAFVSFIVFSVWPRAGRLAYGWFFILLERAQRV